MYDTRGQSIVECCAILALTILLVVGTARWVLADEIHEIAARVAHIVK